MAQILTHVHKYIWKEVTRAGVIKFRCADPHCYYVARKEDILGKASACNKCGTEFILTQQDLLRRKPICIKCSNTKAGKAVRAAEAIANLIAPVEEKDGLEIGFKEPVPEVESIINEEPKEKNNVQKEDYF
jgi:hypothetical protein